MFEPNASHRRHPMHRNSLGDAEAVRTHPGRRASAFSGRLRMAAVLLVVGPFALAAGAARAQVAETPVADPEADIVVEVSGPSALAQFTTGIEDREPIDQVSFVPSDVRKIYFFSDLRGLTGETVTHRWIYDGRTMAEVAFEVRGPRWRVWSSKDLLEDWTGDWTVEIVRSDGEVIAAETFSYTPPGA